MEVLTGADKRTRIILAASHIFATKSFHEAKVEEIAEAAGVGKGTVYEYFRSKQDLFEEMFKSGIEAYLEKIRSETGLLTSAKAKVQKIIAILDEVTIKYRDMAQVIFQAHAWMGPDLKQWLMDKRWQEIEFFRDLVREGIENGEFREVEPQVAALILAGAIHTICGSMIAGRSGPADDYGSQATEIIFRGLAKT